MDCKIKYLAKNPLTYGANESAEECDLSQPRYIRITDITETGLLKNDTYKSLPIDLAKPYLLSDGDILFARSGGTVGKAFLYRSDRDGDACFAGYLIRFSADCSKAYPEFIYYYTQSGEYNEWIKENTIQSTIQNVSAEKYGNLCIPILPLAQQLNIISYLDRLTAKIDVLISDKEKLIELLKEKRQSIISEAVTKGLDSTVPMKDSGVDWIGQIPAHWEMSKSRWLFDLRKDKALPDDEQLTASQQYGIVYQKDYMEQGSRVVQVITGADILKHVEQDDFVISMRSFQGGIEWSNLRGKISSAYVMLIPNKEKVYPPYFRWLLKSDKYIRALQSTSNLVRDGQALRYNNFKQVDLPIVPMSEQKAIAEYLDVQTAKFDVLISDDTKFIDLLKEYRQSVISEAVTGKVKVKDGGIA